LTHACKARREAWQVRLSGCASAGRLKRMVRNRDGSYSYLARSQDVPLDQVSLAGGKALGDAEHGSACSFCL